MPVSKVNIQCNLSLCSGRNCNVMLCGMERSVILCWRTRYVLFCRRDHYFIFCRMTRNAILCAKNRFFLDFRRNRIVSLCGRCHNAIYGRPVSGMIFTHGDNEETPIRCTLNNRAVSLTHGEFDLWLIQNAMQSFVSQWIRGLPSNPRNQDPTDAVTEQWRLYGS